MRRIVLLLVVISVWSCQSVERYNQHFSTPILAKQLQQDVDFTYQKLQKHHPSLYEFIPKQQLDFKFDSVKQSITQPLTPIQFYKKLAPVVAEVRQGHLRLRMPNKKLTQQQREIIKKKSGLFSQFQYVVEDNRLFIKENKDSVKNIAKGTEILKINDIPTQDLLKEYSRFFSSDGYNSTFKKYILAKNWADFYTSEHGFQDSAKLETQLGEEVKTLWISRTEKAKDKEKTTHKKEENAKNNTPTKKSINTKHYQLNFLEKDSSIAVMTIEAFKFWESPRFYRKSFETLQKSGTKFLILDLRNNPGGALLSIKNLYAYLAKEPFRLAKPMEITKPSSAYFYSYRFKRLPFTAFDLYQYPIYALLTAPHIRKKEGKYYLKSTESRVTRPKKTAFGGEIFVLINGGSFSASSVLASKIKNDQRALLVGEETGGANDGTVAGKYILTKLPHSKLSLPIGLYKIEPNITPTNTQKGVTPHHEIVPNLNQILQKEDVEMKWVLEQIKKRKAK